MKELIQKLARQAYAQDALNENPNWKENRLYDELMKSFEGTFEIFAGLLIQEFAQGLVQSNMQDPAYARAMDEYYEKKWAHRFD